MIKKIFAVTLVSATLLAMGCSSDDDEPGDTTEAPEEDFGNGNNLLDALGGADGQFTQLLAAIESAQLGDTFGNVNNTFTMMAPTDAAFDAMDPDDLTALMANNAALSNTLLYHALQGSTDMSTLTAAVDTELTTAAGTPVVITAGVDDAGSPTLMYGTATVTSAAGLEAENGLIHVVDALLEAPAAPVVEEPEVPGGELGAVESTVAATGNHGEFMGQYAALGWQTMDDEAWTLFVPTDAAMAGATVDPQNYVVVNGGALEADVLLAAGSVTTNGGNEFTVAGAADAVTVNGHAITQIATGAQGAIIYSIVGLLQ